MVALESRMEIDKDNELSNIDVKLINNVPQLKIKIDHELAKLGVSQEMLMRRLIMLLTGELLGFG